MIRIQIELTDELKSLLHTVLGGSNVRVDPLVSPRQQSSPPEVPLDPPKTVKRRTKKVKPPTKEAVREMVRCTPGGLGILTEFLAANGAASFSALRPELKIELAKRLESQS